jgi:glycosyltransferase involved in cell wall biosynthesis
MLPITVSAVIPTYKRELELGRAVESVLSQQLPGADVEVIVVNDSGEPLAPAGWQDDPRVIVLTAHRAERCFARNAGASISRGAYLHFLDDDDMLLPGAYAALVERATATSAVWTYGAYEVVDREDRHLETIRPSIRGFIFARALTDAGIPQQASLMERKAFFASGGWNPRFAVCEDQELMLRMAMQGRFECSAHVVARIRRGVEGSGGKWELADGLWRVKWETAMAMPCCLSEVARSLADQNDQLLRMQVARRYLGSALRNLRGGSPLTAVSRLGIGLRVSGSGLLSPGFWRGLRGVKT